MLLLPNSCYSDSASVIIISDSYVGRVIFGTEIAAASVAIHQHAAYQTVTFEQNRFYTRPSSNNIMATLIVYASSGGNTKAVAEYIASKTEGKAVDVSAASSVDLSSFDTIVIGGRVWAGNIPKSLIEFVNKNKDIISQKKSAFYVCCMYNDDKGQQQCDKLAASVGISNHTYFNKAKKLVKENPSQIDNFIASF